MSSRVGIRAALVGDAMVSSSSSKFQRRWSSFAGFIAAVLEEEALFLGGNVEGASKVGLAAPTSLSAQGGVSFPLFNSTVPPAVVFFARPETLADFGFTIVVLVGKDEEEVEVTDKKAASEGASEGGDMDI